MFGMPREAALEGRLCGLRVCSHGGEVVVAVLSNQDPHKAQNQPRAPSSPQQLHIHRTKQSSTPSAKQKVLPRLDLGSDKSVEDASSG